MGEARRQFFNSHKELRGLLKKLNEQQHVMRMKRLS
jgi:hypothetical protein